MPVSTSSSPPCVCRLFCHAADYDHPPAGVVSFAASHLLRKQNGPQVRRLSSHLKPQSSLFTRAVVQTTSVLWPQCRCVSFCFPQHPNPHSFPHVAPYSLHPQHRALLCREATLSHSHTTFSACCLPAPRCCCRCRSTMTKASGTVLPSL
jgi:hypothetical protein